MEVLETSGGTQIGWLDDRGPGGARHKYVVVDRDDTKKLFAGIDFQNGPIGEVGVNGCQNEDLLKIVINRLEDFQEGPLSCGENGIALMYLRSALGWLEARTADRKKRGIEGKLEP